MAVAVPGAIPERAIFRWRLETMALAQEEETFPEAPHLPAHFILASSGSHAQ